MATREVDVREEILEIGLKNMVELRFWSPQECPVALSELPVLVEKVSVLKLAEVTRFEEVPVFGTMCLSRRYHSFDTGYYNSANYCQTSREAICSHKFSNSVLDSIDCIQSISSDFMCQAIPDILEGKDNLLYYDSDLNLSSVYHTGEGIGGYIASICAIDDIVNDKVSTSVTFDSPGVYSYAEKINSDPLFLESIGKHIINFVSNPDLIQDDSKYLGKVFYAPSLFKCKLNKYKLKKDSLCELISESYSALRKQQHEEARAASINYNPGENRKQEDISDEVNKKLFRNRLR